MDHKSQPKYWQWFPLRTREEPEEFAGHQAADAADEPEQMSLDADKTDADVQVEITACCLRTLA